MGQESLFNAEEDRKKNPSEKITCLEFVHVHSDSHAISQVSLCAGHFCPPLQRTSPIKGLAGANPQGTHPQTEGALNQSRRSTQVKEGKKTTKKSVANNKHEGKILSANFGEKLHRYAIFQVKMELTTALRASPVSSL
ncbi:hypothetical protein CDAR_613241 [Caerostris darwini]|uniref:Uncharacterized protein n=1 Tax=Caerostris darwini TaxID=1538125 RepID=A0AAV4ULI2_9ARAC|nr:hypothetical protein CDAR_613241 [Caerostris darwini]